MAAARAKKEKMMKYEQKNKKQQNTNNQKKDSALNRAQEVLNEQLDDVKDMNKMVMYTKCVTVRDKQLKEKKYI